MDRRDFLRVTGGTLLTGTSCAYAYRMLSASSKSWTDVAIPASGCKWGMVIDLNACNDCQACNNLPLGEVPCARACRKENNVAYFGDNLEDIPYNIYWIRRVKIEKEEGPDSHTSRDTEVVEKFVILLCNHCDNPPCAQVCPVQATYKRHDGIVIVDHHRCIGCRYCMIACPYNARWFNFKDDEEWDTKERPKRSHGVAESCTLCAHRLDKGQTPACVEACRNEGAGAGNRNTGALFVGDLNDPDSDVSQLIAGNAVKRIKEDLGTRPKVHYIGL